MRHILLAFSSAALLLSACGTPPAPIVADDAFSSSESPPVAETRNVSYVGTVRPIGISIVMEGTHRLDLDDGRFILLSSEAVDLNGYVGERATVTGAVRPTVEEGDTIMRVEQIRLAESSGSSAPSSEAAAASSADSLPPETAGSSAALPQASSAASVAPVPPPPPAASSAALSPPTPSQTEQVAAMSKQKLEAGNWTQAYCAPPTVGFCFPVHRNWYFKSFGAATAALWHVEVGQQAIENFGDGPLAIDMLGGDVSTKGFADGTVRIEGEYAVGYRSWTKDRHLRIVAPAPLREAVAYVTDHVTASEE